MTLTPLRTPKQAAEYLSVPEATLATWRAQGRGPAFVKLDGRLVRYRQEDLDEYVASQVYGGTREAKAAAEAKLLATVDSHRRSASVARFRLAS